ncbi:MAG: response regulator [Planctomycetota bacterium]|nr:response regulator [Planctomycetota bacterium]
MMSATRRTSVVLVDDEPCVVRVAQAVLSRNFGSALDIYSTTDSKDARDYISKRRCDILLSDIEMPGVHGIEMLKVARRYNAWTRVIFMAAHSTWDRIAEAIENGASDYLLKPVDHDQLISVIQQERDRLVRWQGAVRGTLKIAAS